MPDKRIMIQVRLFAMSCSSQRNLQAKGTDSGTTQNLCFELYLVYFLKSKTAEIIEIELESEFRYMLG